MPIFVQFLAGLILGLGLAVSGMSDPAKVLNFLDLAAMPGGGWDASLAFVMAGAIAVGFFGFRAVLRRPRPVFAPRFDLPPTRGIDARILVGPAIFGVGWGLAGFCPGPAFVALGSGSGAGAIFVAAMLAGMAVARLTLRRIGGQGAR
jgi:uncharacterized membrane protein YedE/YeeE